MLEMVNAGLAPITIVDDYLAEFWSKVFTRHQGAPGHRRAVRRQPGRRVSQGESQAPRGRQHVAPEARQGRRLPQHRSNVAISRTSSTRRTPRPTPSARSSQAVVELFKKYGAQYNLDYLLMAAQGYQESTLDQNVKSPVGAIGVMQVMPADRQGTEGRRHHQGRRQHPRRREVHAVHDGPVLQGRAHGQSEQGA